MLFSNYKKLIEENNLLTYIFQIDGKGEKYSVNATSPYAEKLALQNMFGMPASCLVLCSDEEE